MSYQQGQEILANDYNTFVDLVNEVYADSNSGSLVLGTGDFGYGQTPAILQVSPTDIITASQWTALFDAMNACAVHQGVSMGIVPTSITSGSVIVAITGGSGVDSVINALRASRLSINLAQANVTTNGTKLLESRTADWTNTITHEFDVVFGSTNEARYFFNSGGEVRWSAEYTPGIPDEGNEEIDWQSNILDIGTLKFGADFATADAGAQTGIGYYELTTTYQTILSKSIAGTGVYSSFYYTSEEVRVEVRAQDSSQSTIRFRVSFISDPAADRVLNGTLNSYVDQLRSVGTITVTEPAYTTISFTGS